MTQWLVYTPIAALAPFRANGAHPSLYMGHVIGERSKPSN